VSTFGAAVADELGRQKLSGHAFAQQCGIDPSDFHKILNDLKRPSAEVALKIIEGLGVHGRRKERLADLAAPEFLPNWYRERMRGLIGQ